MREFLAAVGSGRDRAPVSRRTLVLLLTAVAGLFLLSFSLNRNCLQIGQDGAIYTTYLDQQALDRQPFSQSGVDVLQGNFDAYYPLFLEYLLPSLVMRPVADGNPGKVATYFVYAIFLLATLSVVGRSIGFDAWSGLLAGLLVGVLGLPGIVHRYSQLQANFHLNPYWSQDVGLSLLIVAAFWTMRDGKPMRVLALVLAPAACLMLAVVSTGAQVIFMLPATALYSAASLLDAPRWRDDLPRLATALLAVAVPAALSGVYFLGLVEYTAYNHFAAEFEHFPITGALISTFWYSPFGQATIVLGVLGAALAAWRGAGRLRHFALVHLAITAAFLAIGTVVAALGDRYHGSAPAYFEICIWPYSLLFAAALLLDLARVATRAVAALLGAARSAAAPAAYGAPLAIVAVMAGVLGFDATVIAHEPAGFCPAVGFWPARPTAITDRLRRDLALAPGRPFNGVAATITGADRPSVGWLDLSAHDFWLWNAIGNEHRDVGLWRFGVPTLFELFTFITPPYYLVLTDFLARPADRQARSELVFTRIDARMMPLWGVRYVITDGSGAAGEAGQQVAEVPVTYQLPTPRTETLRLVELPDANTGNYSPTEIHHADDFRSGLAALHDPGFDGKRVVVTDATLDGPFVPATDARLVYETYGFHLQAKSTGRSLLVIPAQYSHCWTIEGAGAPALFRADLWELGVSFSGDLDAKLVFHFGPLFASGCRIEDARDMERLRVADGRAHPRAP